jgi:antitoxin ParD1/3/4
MANRATLNVSLTPELEQFVSSRVASGRYTSASEVVRQGLRLLQEQEVDRQATLERLRNQINLGLDQARRGELMTGEAVFDKLERSDPPPLRPADLARDLIGSVESGISDLGQNHRQHLLNRLRHAR